MPGASLLSVLWWHPCNCSILHSSNPAELSLFLPKRSTITCCPLPCCCLAFTSWSPDTVNDCCPAVALAFVETIADEHEAPAKPYNEPKMCHWRTSAENVQAMEHQHDCGMLAMLVHHAEVLTRMPRLTQLSERKPIAAGACSNAI
jgi:hypothetical protein